MAMYPMMGISSMLLSKSICVVVPLIGVLCAGGVSADQKEQEFQCPAAVKIGVNSYQFGGVSVFDGPPENIVSLVPETTAARRFWKFDPRMDPYVICRYKNTESKLVYHLPGYSRCDLSEEPYQAKCEINKN